MEIINSLLTSIWNSLLMVPKILLDLLPLYNTLSSFKQDLIAAALGVSPIVVWLLYKVFSLLKKCFYSWR